MRDIAIVVLALIFAPIMWFVLGGPSGAIFVAAITVLALNHSYCASLGLEPWTGKAYRTSKILGPILSLWFVIEVLDPYPGSWLDRMFFVEPRAFEIDLQLIVDDAPVHLNRRIRCAHGRSLSTLSFFTSAFHYVGIDSFGQKLKSGGAVLVVTPQLCRGKEWTLAEFSDAGRLIPWGNLPLIGWMDDAESPTVTELYIDSWYYMSPKSRIKIKSFGVRPISPWWFMDGHDEFAHFTLGKFGNSALKPMGPRSYESFSAYTLQGITQDIWGQYDNLKNLGKVNRLEVLPLSLVIGPTRRHFSEVDSLEIFRGDRTWPKVSGITENSGPQDSDSSIDTVVPLRLKNNMLTPSYSEQNVLVFYPEFLPDKKTRRYEYRCPYLKLGDQRLSCPIIVRPGGNYIFDPNKKILYRLSKATLAWPLAR